MGLSKNITLTIKDYEIRLDKEIKFYENDTIDLCFSILEYGIEVKDGISINKLMPIQALRSYMLIETPHGIDYAESTKIEDNKIVFNLGTKYSQFVGIGRMQIVVKDSDGCRVTLPEFEFEIKESINMNWDRESFDFLATEDESIIIDEFGRKIHMSKISDMPESENLSEEAYAMIIDEEGNKRFKVKAIADAVEDSLDSKFNAYTDELSGNVEEFKGSIRADVTTLTNENNTFKNQVNTRLANYGSDYNSFKDNVETRLGEHMTDYNRFKDGVETRIEENENAYDGFVSNVSTVLDNYGSSYNSFKSEVNKANASFQSTLNASNQAFRNEMVDRYDNFVYKIDEDIFEGGRTDYFGETHETIGERLELDFDNVHRRIDEGELLDYEGYAITADSSYYGLQRETKVQGRTLQNLLTEGMFDSANDGWGNTLDPNKCIFKDGYVTVNHGDGNYVNIFSKKTNLFKPSTTYTIVFDVKENTLVTTGVLKFALNSDSSIFNETLTNNDYLTIGKHLIKVTTKDDITAETYALRSFIYTSVTGGSITFRYMILEGDHTQTPLEELPFIEGIESIGESELTDDGYKIRGKSCGKNLWCYKNEIEFPIGFVRTWYDINGKLGYYGSDVLEKSNTWIYLPKGVYYLNSELNNCSIQIIDVNEKDVELTNWRGGLISVRVHPLDETQTASVKNIIISSSPTSYEPYQESNYSYILDEPLRSLPSGACDTIDLETGVLTRRIGKVVIDDSVKPLLNRYDENYSQFVLHMVAFNETNKPVNVLTNDNIICDTKPAKYRESGNNSVWIYDGSTVILQMPSNINSQELMQQWLNSNPTTIYYELATPATEQLSEQRINSFDGITHVISDNKIMSKITTRIPTDLGNNVNNRLNNLNDKIDDHKNETDNACIDYFGYNHPSLQDRLISDFDKLNTKIEGYGYIPYEGTSIYATNTMEGSVNNTVVKGRTLQNLAKEYATGSATWEVTDNAYNLNISESTTQSILYHSTWQTLKPNTVYTLIINVLEYVMGALHISLFDCLGSNVNCSNEAVITEKGVKVYKLTTFEGVQPNSIRLINRNRVANNYSISKSLIILEGDYTEVPLEELPYIEGIESVGDKSKNLIVITPNKRIERSGITLFENDGKLFADGTTSKVISANETIWDELIKWNAEEGKQYKVSIFNPISNMATATRTITDDVYNSTVGIYIPTDITFENYEIKIQVEEGASTTEYNPPYDGYKISGKSCGKNLFDDFLEYGLWSWDNKEKVDSTSYIKNKKLIQCKPNTKYIFSGNAIETFGGNLALFDKDKNYLNKQIYSFQTFTTPNDAYFFAFHVAVNAVNDINGSVQLEEGTTPTSYEPYKESTYSYILNEPLRSLPNGVCDELNLETGFLTRRVGKIVLNGSEDWSATGYGGHATRNTFEVTFKRSGNDGVGGPVNGYCDRFPYELTSSVPVSDGVRISRSVRTNETDEYLLICPPTSLIPHRDITAWKDYLSNNNVTVYCQLYNETTEQLTPQQLKSFDTTTHIISDNKLMPIVSTDIPTDLSAVINTLSLRNRELEEVNEQQDELIDITMMATDEMYSMLEPLMEAVEPMGLLDCSKMAQMYVAMVQRGIKKIEDIPRRYQEEVREALGIKIEEEEWGEDDGIK